MRRLLAGALAFFSALMLVLASVAWWTTATALDTPRFVAIAGPVIDQAPVQAAVSTALADQLTSLVGLPQLRPAVRGEVASIVAGPTFRALWYASVTVAHSDVVAALTGPAGSGPTVSGSSGTVSVDLVQVVAQVLHALPPSVAAVLGHGRTLAQPAGQTSAQVRTEIAAYLGQPLPPGFGTVPVASTTTLDRARTAVQVLNGSVLVLGAIGVLALLAALVVSPRRLRTIGQVALWGAVMTALAYFALDRFGAMAATAVPAGPVSPAVSAVVQALFDSLRAPTVVICVAAVVVAVVTRLPGRAR